MSILGIAKVSFYFQRALAVHTDLRGKRLRAQDRQTGAPGSDATLFREQRAC